MTKEEIVQVAMGNMEIVYEYVRELLEQPKLTFQCSVRDGYYGKVIELESSNIESNDTIFNLMFKSMKVVSTGNAYIDKETNEAGYALILHFQYQHHDFGRNGVEFLSCYCNEKGEWIFRASNEK